MRSVTNSKAKRKLLTQVAARYQEASHPQKPVILDVLVVSTGRACKCAIPLLMVPVVSPAGGTTLGEADR
jgi:hypothetical protein